MEETNEEIKVLKESIEKEKKRLNQKRTLLSKSKIVKFKKSESMDDCYDMKKQGLEVVEKQKAQNAFLAEQLFMLEQELQYLQVADGLRIGRI